MATKVKVGFLKDRYSPLPYAQTYMYGSNWQQYRDTGLRVSIIKDVQSSDERWVRFYAGRKRIWDCNYIFFKENFVKVQG